MDAPAFSRPHPAPARFPSFPNSGTGRAEGELLEGGGRKSWWEGHELENRRPGVRAREEIGVSLRATRHHVARCDAVPPAVAHHPVPSPHPPTSPQSRRKSPFEFFWICTGARRIPTNFGTHQGARTKRFCSPLRLACMSLRRCCLSTNPPWGTKSPSSGPNLPLIFLGPTLALW